jgi:hypothetical protein
MTTIVGINRPRAYALFSNDNICYHIGPGEPPEGRPELTLGNRQKVVALSDYVLVSAGGCPAIGDDCFARLAGRVAAGDGFDACYAAARSVVDELLADDVELAGSNYQNLDLAGAPQLTRCSILDDFALHLIGFEQDGSTGAAQWQNSSNAAWDDGAYQHGDIVISAPYGLDLQREVIPFLEDFYGSAGCPTIAEGFSYAFGVHRILGHKYPTRLSPDVNVLALRWVDERTELLSLRVDDYNDIDAFFAAYEQLATGGGP